MTNYTPGAHAALLGLLFEYFLEISEIVTYRDLRHALLFRAIVASRHMSDSPRVCRADKHVPDAVAYTAAKVEIHAVIAVERILNRTMENLTVDIRLESRMYAEIKLRSAEYGDLTHVAHIKTQTGIDRNANTDRAQLGFCYARCSRLLTDALVCL